MTQDLKALRDHIIRQEAMIKLLMEQHNGLWRGVTAVLHDLHVQLAKAGDQTEREAAMRLRLLRGPAGETNVTDPAAIFVAALAELLAAELAMPGDLVDEPPQGTA